MQPAVVAKLVSGQLPQTLHLRYLMLLHSVYTALETGLDTHSSHQLLCTTYQPALLARAPSLDADVAFFCGGSTEWKKESEVWSKIVEDKLESLRDYVGRLDELAKSETDAYLLLAHSYVRYLGDLSGGQSIARIIRKNYHLPATGEGSQFYEFYLPTSTTPTGLPISATLNETKEIKNWFRAGLDEAGERMTEQQRQNVVDEARRAFELNINLFASFEGLVKDYSDDVEANGTTTTTMANGHGVASKTSKDKEVDYQSPKSGALTWIGVILAVVFAAYIAYRDVGKGKPLLAV
ncbi:heme oxygenase-like protein [Meredithblackwellia eburnea MCA 4105]